MENISEDCSQLLKHENSFIIILKRVIVKLEHLVLENVIN